MDIAKLMDLAGRTGLCVTLTFDPTADESERWITWVGLDSYGSGPTAADALADAELRHHGYSRARVGAATA